MSRPARAACAEAADCPLVVVGAHLRGMPLNHELTALGAKFVREDRTAPDYRLYALPGPEPRKPGLLRAPPGEGVAVSVEVWRLGAAALGRLVAAIPPPLSVGKVRLASDELVPGFLCEAVAAEGAEDISRHGGWRAYRRSLLPTA